ncbi:MAG TPA: YceD family protein [Steroidobacteraceae bacterium]|nr:YceD family protein [Steroidobacteraceae bacterium]
MSRDPELLDLAALIAQGSELEIDCELKSLTRLAPLLSDSAGTAHGKFRFHRVAGAPAAEGRVTATLPVTCQRCMGDLAIAVDTECRLVFADADAANAEASIEEELVTTHGGRISLAELVEEELLLAMPLVAVHGEGSGCSTQAAAGVQAAGEPKQRPFAGLRDLLKDGK